MKRTARIRVAQFGLGPIGIETLKLAAAQPWAEVIGAIDIDPAKVGCDLCELMGVKTLRGSKVHDSLTSLLAARRPDLIFHTAVSKLAPAAVQIEPMIRAGISVVSSCEELLFPAGRDAKLAARLDRLCRKYGARVNGTGVNPGFVMDLLPVCLTGVSREVNALHLERVVNASTRREPLQRKIGSGLPPAEFRRRLKRGEAGHAGLRDSLNLVAHCLGWVPDKVTESGDAIVAERDLRTAFLAVKAGETCGLHQRAEARVKGKVRLTLDLKMYLDAPDPHDAIEIVGDPPLRVVIAGGTAGDVATVAVLVNTAPRLLCAPPGLHLVTDLSVPRAACLRP